MPPEPYRTTPVFDERTLPPALRREHRTKAGVWGVLRVIEGRLRLSFGDGTPSLVLAPDLPGLLRPEQPHQVEPLGSIRMQIEFYEVTPEL